MRAVYLAFSIVLAGFGPTATAESRVSGELLVGAAVSTSKAVRELAEHFQNENPGIKVKGHFAASGTVLRQLQRGGRLDIVLFADLETFSEAAKMGVRLEIITKVASNRLMLVASSAVDAKIENANDLIQDCVARIAVGNPAYVPLGRYSRKALEAANLYERLKTKIVPAGSAAQAVRYIASGNVDAGVVYASDLAALGDDAIAVEELPLAETPGYYTAVVSDTVNKAAAYRFLNFMTSRKGGDIFARNGFGPAEIDR